MRKRAYVFGLCLIIALVTFLMTKRYIGDSETTYRLKAQELESVVKTREDQLVGYTAYETSLTAAKSAVVGQAKLLAASLTREEGTTQVMTRKVLPGLSSSATVAVWYKVQYSFGFDLDPTKYDVRASGSGIEVIVGKPVVVATPSVSNLRHSILSEGLLTDEKAATLKLYELASERVRVQGLELARDPAVIAMCEKNLVEFLRNFLGKQPGVKYVPYISVSYK